jgi:hypothetical protein
MYNNRNLKVDIVELVAKVPPTLKQLDLEDTGCFGDAGKADWARLPALERLELGFTNWKISGSKEDLKAAGCAAGHIEVHLDLN